MSREVDRLLSPDDVRSAEKAATRVYQSIGTGVSEPFRAQLGARMLIYPTDYTMLTSEQFQALSAGAALMGDTSAYVVPYGTLDAGWAGTYDHRLIDLGNYGDYRPPGALVLEHLLYSPTGRWGIVTSDGGEAIVGGSDAFVEEIRSQVGDAEEDMAMAFVRDQRAVGQGGGNIEWLRPLLRHIYGDVGSKRLWDAGDGGAGS
jgi:hypothetical protein